MPQILDYSNPATEGIPTNPGTYWSASGRFSLQIENDRIVVERVPLTKWGFYWRVAIAFPAMLLVWAGFLFWICAIIFHPRKLSVWDFLLPWVLLSCSIGLPMLIAFFRNRCRFPIRFTIDPERFVLIRPGIGKLREKSIPLDGIHQVTAKCIERRVASTGELFITRTGGFPIRLLVGDRLDELELVAATMNHAIGKWRRGIH